MKQIILVGLTSLAIILQACFYWVLSHAMLSNELKLVYLSSEELSLTVNHGIGAFFSAMIGFSVVFSFVIAKKIAERFNID